MYIIVLTRFSFEGRKFVLIAPAPGHRYPFTFSSMPG